MAKINRTGSYGKGKNRTNCPSAKSYKARSGDADARDFDGFEKVGGYDSDPLMPGHARPGIGGPSNSGNE
jgi:hypothetical protein